MKLIVDFVSFSYVLKKPSNDRRNDWSLQQSHLICGPPSILHIAHIRLVPSGEATLLNNLSLFTLHLSGTLCSPYFILSTFLLLICIGRAHLSVL